MSEGIEIRQVQVSDAASVCDMCAETVRKVNKRDYSTMQVEKWSGRLEMIDCMKGRLNEQNGLVAILNKMPVGIVTWTDEGYLDLFYIHADHQGEGIGARLMNHLVDQLPKGFTLTSDVSITARPFFEKFGFEMDVEQTVAIDGVPFTNYSMKLKIT